MKLRLMAALCVLIAGAAALSAADTKAGGTLKYAANISSQGALELDFDGNAYPAADVARVLGLPLARVWTFRQASACLNLLEGTDLDHLQVVRINDASHLIPLFGEVVHRRL